MRNPIKQTLKDWFFKEATANDWKRATVPGCVHTDLLNNGAIEDPFYGKNELDMQWIDKTDWEYQTTFLVRDDVLEHEKVELSFEGLDTYADVYVNGNKILEADNMFRIWKADVKSHLQQGDNQLTVYFHSPIQHDLHKPDQLGYNLPADNDHSEDGGVGEKKLSVFARKAPYHYGWDWGPRFVTSGIWKEVYLEAWSEARVLDVHIKQPFVSENRADLVAEIEVEATNETEVIFNISDQHSMGKEQNFRLKKGVQHLHIPITIDNPKLWWSNGLGEPYLYHFQIDLILNDDVRASHYVRTGLRSIRLVRDSDKYGQSFYFELNGVPVFAKGANHIPNDSFQTSITRERYRHEIATAAHSNMNMLRVWGGGIYEYDEFYKLCDEYGILVWQDFMFACSMYPGDEAFIESVKKEAIDNVKRLRNYACIALWCGNNEMDAAWSEYEEQGGWGWKQRYNNTQRQEIWKAYDDIFHHILPSVLEKYDANVDYWPSSPMQELSYTKEQHATFDTVQRGDVHYWDVWHGQKPVEAYKDKVGRFMSEYGFQSFPEKKTVLTYAEEEGLALESDIMLHHQKNGAGNRLIKNYMEMYYHPPKDFSSFLRISHILQADAIKSAVEAHRLNMPYCMGTLYWQLNDCWPVASWSSMDYFGRWKALQYVIKDRFKPNVLIVDQTEKGVHFYTVSDQLQSKSVNLHISIYTFSGEALYTETKEITMKANTSTKVKEQVLEDLIAYRHDEDIVLYAEIEEQGRLIDNIVHLLDKPKHLTFENPEIHLEYSEQGIVVESQKFASHVWLETDIEGYFTENNFHLIPGMKKIIPFYKRTSTEKEAFQKENMENIRVVSMYDLI
ncbi:glycoside hydrolase family 2 protein [Gracilibacillus sp. YIM 98692]|uniref:beta-mannosidase n=1 Tax=Gracilibacillus sp. YIM 98692 TaxID=2663532 RepID=UPI001F08A125|nr:glycoside hydrolase family 2 protein [Gracilibacillus sp. YIM 98692]